MSEQKKETKERSDTVTSEMKPARRFSATIEEHELEEHEQASSATHDKDKESMMSPAKMVLHGGLLLLFYVWWDLFGYWIAPLALYTGFLMLPVQIGHWDLATRMQIRGVIIIYFTVVSMPLLTLWIIFRGNWFIRTAFAAYIGWYTFVDKAPKSGGRFLPTLRQRSFWRHFASYFPIQLTRTAELDPTRNYIFGYHPHGIISLGALCNFATDATGFAKLFPGIDLRLLTLDMNFRIPFFREYLLGLGVNDASRGSCLGNLKRGPGASIMLVVGGARESLETKPGHADLVLSKRKGFVKMALRTGASLVPVFSFGENDVFGVYHSDGAMSWQLKMQKKLGFAVPFFFGRALTGGILHRLFGLNVGVMPLRVPIHSVVGNPIHLEQVKEPTDEQVDKAHAQYIEELQRIYTEFKDEYAKERAQALNNCDASKKEAMKILHDSKFKLDDLDDLHMVD